MREVIQSHIPEHEHPGPGGGGQLQTDDRACMGAIFFVLHTGY